MNDPAGTDPLAITMSGVVLDSLDARVLADFYSRLLGWPIGDYDPGWSTVKNPSGGTQLSFQGEPSYQPPNWPTKPNSQQMMLHLDFNVDDLAVAHVHAVAVWRNPSTVATAVARSGLHRSSGTCVLSRKLSAWDRARTRLHGLT
ncbi:hypothetical protein SAMN04489717_3508 [Actinopolymorpha singaporensis]|uniref:Glyoxalase-like domain-containing protein n=2 Tax=Actinopolymorpha singaporensis TaxID=117157 RepID=A0A1H1U8U1_9ACTN|nr:hypothetical protein SAMN04489717_3508 [Actinopolymorpha singaporensis]